jgi:hypothetical protein
LNESPTFETAEKPKTTREQFPIFPHKIIEQVSFSLKKKAPKRERERLTSTIINKTTGDKDSLRFISSVNITAKINSVKTQIHNFSKNINLVNPNNTTKKNELGD